MVENLAAIREMDQAWSKKGQYCMARHNDRGAYAIGNVSIVSVSQNNKDRKIYIRDDQWKRNQGKRMRGNTIWLGRKHSDQTKKRISRSNKGRVPGFGGKHHSEATKEYKRLHWKNQYTSS